MAEAFCLFLLLSRKKVLGFFVCFLLLFVPLGYDPYLQGGGSFGKEINLISFQSKQTGELLMAESSENRLGCRDSALL